MIPKILVVDDESSVRITIAEFLKDAGYEVHSAEDAYEAMLLLKEVTFSLVITDLIMPKINGMDLIKDLHENYKDTMVVVMTGHPTDKTYLQSMNEYQVYEYLSKPVLKDDIRSVVKRALES